MVYENGLWQVVVGDDGKEVIKVGTPEFPMEIWGPWDGQPYERCGSVPWHWHDEVEINYVTEGSLLGMADGKSFRLQAGQALFVGSGVLHGNRAVEENGLIHQISIVFDPSVVGGASGSVFWQKYLGPVLCAPECRCIPILGGAVWEQQALAELQHIAELWPRKAPGYEFEVRAALSRVIFLLAENCLQHAQAPSERDLRDAERIKQMIDFVRAHRAEAITTEQIAASAAISVSECLRCFRRMMDLTPKEYLRQHRIRHAVQLLENTDKSITRIGEECGFEDMSYFARVFRAEKGCTPSEYREKEKGGG